MLRDVVETCIHNIDFYCTGFRCLPFCEPNITLMVKFAIELKACHAFCNGLFSVLLDTELISLAGEESV